MKKWLRAVRDLRPDRGPRMGRLSGVGPRVRVGRAGSAAGSLALARMADDRELLDAGADVGEAGLTEDEARELLGGGG